MEVENVDDDLDEDDDIDGGDVDNVYHNVVAEWLLKVDDDLNSNNIVEDNFVCDYVHI